MSFTIPTYFTAVDQLSSPVRKMQNSMEHFAVKTEAGIDRAERSFRKMLPHVSHITKELFEFASVAAVAGTAVELIHFSFEAVDKYNESIANLSASTGVSGKQLENYESQIMEVANASRKSATDVAGVFDVVAKANPDLINNAEALGKISDASILFAKASTEEMIPATHSITDAMTKMQLGAEDAAGFVDVLAAASLAGKYKMNELADGLTKFTSTSKLLNMSLAEDTALLQLSGQFRKAGEGATESGDHISKFLMKVEGLNRPTKEMSKLLHKAGVDTKLLSSPTTTLVQRLSELQKIANNGALMDKVFGARQGEYAKGLLTHASGLQAIIDKTSEKGHAEEMAAARENTLQEALKRLSSAWENMLIGTNGTNGAIQMLINGMDWLSKNLPEIIGDVKWFAEMIGSAWLALKIMRGWIWLTQATATAFFIVDMIKYVASTQGISFATAAWTVAQESLNVAMLANPVGIFLIAIMALAAGIMYTNKLYDDLMNSINASKQKGADATRQHLNSEVQRLEQVKHMGEREAQQQAWLAEKKIAIKNYEAARMAEIAAKNNTGFFGMSNLDEAKAAVLKRVEAQSALVALTKKDVFDKPGVGSEAVSTKPAIDLHSQRAQNTASTVTNNINKKLSIDFKNVPKGVEISGDTGADGVTPSTSSTMKQ